MLIAVSLTVTTAPDGRGTTDSRAPKRGSFRPGVIARALGFGPLAHRDAPRHPHRADPRARSRDRGTDTDLCLRSHGVRPRARGQRPPVRRLLPAQAVFGPRGL